MLEGTKKVVYFSIVVAALFSYYLAHLPLWTMHSPSVTVFLQTMLPVKSFIHILSIDDECRMLGGKLVSTLP